MGAWRIKQIYLNHFRDNEYFSSCHVEMRPFNAAEDAISTMFSQEDWNYIFSSQDRTILQKWVERDDRVVLTCVDKQTKQIFGFIALFQPRIEDNDVWFYGGTWSHNRMSALLAYEGLHEILRFLSSNKFNIRAGCYRINKRSEALLRHFGFIEITADEDCSYKQLDHNKFANNGIEDILKRCFARI